MEQTIENTITAPVTPNNTNKLLSGSFGWMAIGLLISAVTAFIVLISPTILDAVYNIDYAFQALLLLQLGAVIFLSARINAMSIGTARATFIGYSILSGITLSVVFFTFELGSIFGIFLGAAAMFGGLALFGMKTTKDLTSIGRLAMFGLLGLIIASIVSLFTTSTLLDLILAWVGVAIFTVLISYDVQKLKKLGESTDGTMMEPEKIVIIGALNLYLDFINLFLSLLRIFGKRR